MKTLINLYLRHGCFLCLLLLVLSFPRQVFSQDCTSTIPNTSVCSSIIAENFNAGSGGFTGTGLTWSESEGNWTKDFSGLGTGPFIVAMTSPAYYKLLNNPNTLRTGFRLVLDKNTKISITGVVLDIIRESDGAVIASCNNFNTSSTTTANTAFIDYCTGVFSTNITTELMFMYRFTFTLSIANGGNATANTFQFDNFSYGGDSNAPLPVEFTSFTAKRSGTTVLLNWETATELNNKGFEIQRSLESGKGYENLSFVSSKSAQGNSTGKMTYSFSDVNLSSANSFYRIRQVDLDGRYQYSETRMVEGVKNKTRVLVYPNPSLNGEVNISFASSDPKNIQVTDLNGRVTRQWSSYPGLALKIDHLSPGMYMIQVNGTDNSYKETQRMVVIK